MMDRKCAVYGARKGAGRRNAISAVLLAVVMIFGLAGCGEGYDPTGLVQANLDYMTGGEATEDVLAETDQSAEELNSFYQAELGSSIDSVLQGLQTDLGEDTEEELRLLVGTFITDAMKKAKYEVKPEFTENESVYQVDVEVYPMDLLDKTQAWIEGGEYLDEWKKMVRKGEYVYTTDEQLMEDIYRYMYEKASAFVEEAAYLDPVTVTVKVEEKDGTYLPDQQDLAAVITTALGE